MSELLKINVNDHTEKKNGLTYLSWAWAWAEVLKIDPLATWAPHQWGPENSAMPVLFLPGGSAMVAVTVIIKGRERSCQLPVMDHRNKAIQNPDAMAINTAIMRCLAKAIAMHGLGLYIYAGEDLPEAEKLPPPVSPKRMEELEALAVDMLALQEEGRELAAAQAYYALADNDEKLALWGMLKGSGGGSTPESRLRSFIKANKPEEKTE
jgi:Protein of unknown function (DUF1071)